MFITSYLEKTVLIIDIYSVYVDFYLLLIIDIYSV